MSTIAKVGIGVRIYRHHVSLYYDTARKTFVGNLYLDMEQADGTYAVWFFEVQLSGKYFLFDFRPPQGPLSLSLKQVASKLFGAEDAAHLPDIELNCSRVFFLHIKAVGEHEAVTAGGVELAVSGIEFSGIKTSLVSLGGSHLKLDKILLAHSGAELKLKSGQKKEPEKLTAEEKNEEERDQAALQQLLDYLNIKELEKGFQLGALIKEGKNTYHAMAPMKEPKPTTEEEEDRLPALRADKPKVKKTKLEKWAKLDKKIGPITLQRVGIRLEANTGKAKLLLDAYMQAAGLEISLLEFGLAFDLKHQLKREVTLGGLGVGFSSGGFALSGAFMRMSESSYAGMLNLKWGDLNIFGIGAYQKVLQQTSMFGYVVLKYPLGGPTQFYVTGLAAGFGYHRDLILPKKIDEVEKFPLIQWAKGGEDPIKDKKEPDQLSAAEEPKKEKNKASLLKQFPELVKQIDPIIPYKKDQYWLAFGVEFTSFKYVKGFLLLTASFGNRLEIALLGTATLEKEAVKVDIVLKARYAPDEGVFGLEAAVSKGSYIMSPDCKLSGGLAYYTWFSGDHAGDFVFSIGGYHPRYAPPEHYPSVQRVALEWKVSEYVQISGESYFAITPSCMMAGFKAQAIVKLGNLKATFLLFADLLIQWAPFYYDLSIGIGIEVAYHKKTWLGTLKFNFSLGATLDICGPEFSGVAKVKCSIVSFTIKFGKANSGPEAISWDDFKKEFLTTEKGEQKEEKVLTIAALDGLREEVKVGDTPIWIIDPEQLDIKIDSAIPVKKATGLIEALQPKKNTELGIRSMKKNDSDFDTSLHVEIIAISSEDKMLQAGASIAAAVFDINKTEEKLPSAIWGKHIADKKKQLNAASLIEDVTTGYRLRTQQEIDTTQWKEITGGAHQQGTPLEIPTVTSKWTYQTEGNTTKQKLQDQLDQSRNSTKRQTLKALTDTGLFPALDAVVACNQALDIERWLEERHGIMPKKAKKMNRYE